MVDTCECGNEPPSPIKCGEFFLPGRAKDLSAPHYYLFCFDYYVHFSWNKNNLLAACMHGAESFKMVEGLTLSASRT